MVSKLKVVAGTEFAGKPAVVRQGFKGQAPEEITRAVIDRLASEPDAGKDVYIQDLEVPGFKLRRDRTGRITFVFIGRVRGGVGTVRNRLKSKTLGLAKGKGAITVAAARSKALALRQELGEGVDPDAKKRASAAAIASAEAERRLQTEVRKWTPLFALEHMLDWRASRPNPEDRLRPETVEYYRRGIGYLPGIAKVPIVELRAEAIRKALDKVDGAAKPAKARRALSGVINHAIKRLELNIPNPVSRLDRGEFKAPPPRRSYIPESEVGAFVGKVVAITIAGKPRDAQRVRHYLLLTFLYGTRKFELMHLEWDWINWKTRTLTIPGEHRKNGDAHTLPLTDWTGAILKSREADRRPGERYVFPGNKKGRPLMDVRESLSKALGANFKLHDARRTLVTHCAALGIAGTRLKALVGHARDGVTEFYDQRELEQMRRDFATYHQWVHERWTEWDALDNRPEPDAEQAAADAAEQREHEEWLAQQSRPAGQFPGL